MEDEEIQKIKERKLAEMMRKQAEFKIQEKVDVIELDSSNFDKIVAGDKPTLVDFWAEWCGPCRSMHPVFIRLSRKFKGITFARLNVDNSNDIAMRFSVKSIPTFIMFKKGQSVDRVIGAVGEPGINLIAQKYS